MHWVDEKGNLKGLINLPVEYLSNILVMLNRREKGIRDELRCLIVLIDNGNSLISTNTDFFCGGMWQRKAYLEAELEGIQKAAREVKGHMQNRKKK